MIELKVHCDCGQKYKFDVEPVNGQMPFTVACPICKRDGTAKANAMLQQMSVFKPVEAAPIAPIAPIAAVAPPPPPIAGAPPVPTGAPRLRINAAAPAAEPPQVSNSAPPPIAPARGVSLPPTGRRLQGVATPAEVEPGKKPSFAMGLLGALVGAVVGALLYFVIYKTTGPIPFLRYFLALGVGGLTGWLANFLGKGEGSKELGAWRRITVIAIVSAQYFLTMQKWHQTEDKYGDLSQDIADGGYAASVKEAKDVIKAVPSGSDSEIRMYIAKQQAEEGQAPKMETVSSDEVTQFRETELTNYQDLASGKLSQEQYWAKNGFDPEKAKKIMDTGEKAVSGLALILAVLKAGIVSMIVGAGVAFRLSANA